MLADNNGASDKYSQAETSEDWRAIDGRTGAFLIPDGKGTTENSVKLDYIDGRWVYVTDVLTDPLAHYRFCDFADVEARVCEEARELLCALGLIHCGDRHSVEGVSLYANNGAAERIPFRGGRWGQGLNAGVFKTCVDDPRTYAGEAVGFRCAYCAE